jgi:hypothetical protein
MAQRYKNIDDEYKWALETAAAVRAKDWDAIDRKALLNELECSIAGGLRRELVSTLREIVEAILVMDYTTGNNVESNRQLVHAQGQLQLLLHSTPSLRDVIGDVITKAYRQARDNVSEDYAVHLPERCPVSLERILEDPYDRVMAEEQSA